MLLTGVGGVWLLLGASGLDGAARSVATVTAVLGPAAALVLLRVRRRRGTVAATRRVPSDWRARLARVNVAQSAAIAVVVLTCVLAGAPWLIPSLVCAVVAVHFVPLVVIFGEPVYRGTAAGLAVVALLGALALLAGAAATRATVGAGAAACLWTSAVVLARRA